MVEAALAILFGCSLFLVYYWKTRQPLPDQPLSVEDNLPLPWLAQTSTVFALTALFGAYFGIAAALGLPALLGLACGTVAGLFLIRYWIVRTLAESGEKEKKPFETFLSRVLSGNTKDATVYAIAIALIQIIFAVSELLILRELSKVTLGLKSELATLLAIGVAILGYFYVLLGGYIALFRTDRVQLILVCLMALAVSVFLIIRTTQAGWSTVELRPRPGFWEIPFTGITELTYTWHFFVATTMGLGLFLASPDTWKRVYQVNKDQISAGRNTFRTRVLTFVGVGVLPYLVLLPLAITVGTKSNALTENLNPCDQVNKGFTIPPALTNKWILLILGLGLVASFLSSFNGAFLASVHVMLVWARKTVKNTPRMPEEARFYLIMMTVLSAIIVGFLVAVTLLATPSRNEFRNPWILGNLLMGGYALIGGIQLGTAGKAWRLPKYFLPAIFAIGLAIWVRSFATSPGFSKCPTIWAVNTVPMGVMLCLGTALVSRLCIIFGERK